MLNACVDWPWGGCQAKREDFMRTYANSCCAAWDNCSHHCTCHSCLHLHTSYLRLVLALASASAFASAIPVFDPAPAPLFANTAANAAFARRPGLLSTGSALCKSHDAIHMPCTCRSEVKESKQRLKLSYAVHMLCTCHVMQKMCSAHAIHKSRSHSSV